MSSNVIEVVEDVRLDPMTVQIASAVLGALLTVVVWNFFKLSRKKGTPFPRVVPSSGHATKLKVVGNRGGTWGPRGSLDRFNIQKTGEEVALNELLADKTVSLYQISHKEKQFIFVKTSKEADLWAAHHFYDVAQAMHAEELYVATYEDCFRMAQQLKGTVKFGESNCSYIFNTGRCGSTLLHKLLLRAGICSLSEPEWSMGILKVMDSYEDEMDPMILALLDSCHTLAFHSAQLNHPDAKLFSFNPKCHLTSRFLPVVHRLYPEMRLVFLSRPCAEVVESFSSIMARSPIGRTPAWKKVVSCTYFTLLHPVVHALGLSRHVVRPLSPRIYNGIVSATRGRITDDLFLRPFWGKVPPLAYLWAVDWATQVNAAQKANNAGVELLQLDYANLKENKEVVLLMLFGYLGLQLSRREMDHVLEGFNEHSQKQDERGSAPVGSGVRPKYLSATHAKVVADMGFKAYSM